MDTKMAFCLSCFLIASLVFTTSCKKSKKRSKADALLETEYKNLKSVSCKDNKMETLMRHKAAGDLQRAFVCTVAFLRTTNDIPSWKKAFLYSFLGDLYRLRKESSKSETIFKEAAKEEGKSVKYVRTWHFLGPFTIGKGEVDGDPVKGRDEIAKLRWDWDENFFSETVHGGVTKWRKIQQKGAQYPVEVNPAVNWNELISALQSMGVTEWQGWLLGDFALNEAGLYKVQCLGVAMFFVNDVIVTGDVYRREHFWFPIFLEAGIHTVFIKLRAKGPTNFSFKIQALGAAPYQIHQPTFLPDLVEGNLFSHLVSVPVANYQTKWITISKVILQKQSSGISLMVSLLDDHVQIAPGQILPIKLQLSSKTSTVTKDSVGCHPVHFEVKFYFLGLKTFSLPLTLRCRMLAQSFLFTFLDHDGSVQHGAAISPPSGCGVSCPTLLTLHGTTVPPQNQADSYKRMENGKWVFGVEGLWVVAPTRHGAHNWEGPGERTSMTALTALSKLTENAAWIPSKALSDAAVIAGHSMGGHGAWQLSTHHPDITLAVISAAGWIKKENYGDSNLFFRHDIAASHTDPVVKSVMEACTAENDADKHASNLQGIPVLIRVGAADHTVHPYFTRRMNRVLREGGVNVTYEEVKDKEHWWWDTFSTNDGGVTNDPVIRKFTVDHTLAYQQLTTSTTCTSEHVQQDGCSTNPSSHKYSGGFQGRNLLNGGNFELVVYNPASSSGLRGVRILQQIVPFRKSVVRISLVDQKCSLSTTNVQRMSLTNIGVLFPIAWLYMELVVDGIRVNTDSLQGVGSTAMVLCGYAAGEASSDWALCKNQNSFESEEERGPENVGPARRVAEKPFLIVTGTLSKNMTNTLRHHAVYLANLFYLTSDAYAGVVEDLTLTMEVAKDYNLIILGNPMENSWSGSFFEKVPVGFSEDSSFRLGDCSFQEPHSGVLFLAPHAGSRLAMVLAGASLRGTHDIIQLATPTIPPMTRSPFSNMVPDFVITGPKFQAHGAGGYQCVGFWGNSWNYARELASCAC